MTVTDHQLRAFHSAIYSMPIEGARALGELLDMGDPSIEDGPSYKRSLQDAIEVELLANQLRWRCDTKWGR